MASVDDLSNMKKWKRQFFCLAVSSNGCWCLRADHGEKMFTH